MDQHERPPLVPLLHQVFYRPRILLSPLLLQFVGIISLGWMVNSLDWGGWQRLAGQATVALTLVSIGHAWHRANQGGIARDWRLSLQDTVDDAGAHRGAESMIAAIFAAPWFVWWISVNVHAASVALWWDMDIARASSGGLLGTVYLFTPATTGLWLGVRPGEEIWEAVAWVTALALTTVIAALWALVMHRITVIVFCRVRRPVASFAAALAALLPLRILLKEGVSTVQEISAYRLQHHFPYDWPLPAKMMASLYTGWFILPFILILLLAVTEKTRRKAITHWWERVE